MASIANLLVSLKTDFGSSDSALDSFIAKLTQVGSEAEKTGAKVHDASEKVEGVKHGTEGGEGALESLKETFADLGKEILTFGAEAVALTSVFEALKEAVEVSAQLESTKVALESLTGSAEKANEVLESMETIARAEGLSFPELIPAAQHMIALGFSVEQTAEAMAAAGNAAWALGQPIASIDQRLGFLAQSGRVSDRFLRTLGITTEDLGKIMGISAGEVAKTFQALSQTDRLEILIAALQKFGDVGSKEADTVKGRWNELKNSWHEAFAVMGDDLEGLTKSLETFGTGIGNAITNFLILLKHVPKTKQEDNEALLNYLQHPFDTPLKKEKTREEVLEEATKEPAEEGEPAKRKFGGDTYKGADALEEKKSDIKEKVQVARGPLEAKEYAATRLEEIRGAEEANKRFAQLNREKTESAIKEEHLRRQAEIDENEDATARARLTAEEEIRVAKEKQEKIGSIDAEEARKKAELIRAKVGPEIAKTYTPIANDDSRAAKISAINQKAKNDLEALAGEVVLKQQKATDAVTAAVSKQLITEAKITLGQTKTERDVAGNKLKSDADIKSIEYLEQKIELEGAYEAQISHTYAQQIAKLNEVADLERKSREAHIEGLQGKLENIPATKTDDAATKERASLQAEIAKAKAESAKADAASANQIIAADVEHLKTLREVSSIQSKSDADIKVQKIDQQKLKAESDYAAQLSHTDEEHIAHLKQIAAIENAQRQAKIEGLKNQLEQVPQGDDPEFLKKRSELSAEIADQQEASNTATLQSAIQITQQMESQNKLLSAQKGIAQTLTNWHQIDLGDVAKDFSDSIVKVPQGLGSAIATGLFDHEKGKNMGQVIAKEMVTGLKQEAKNLVGTLVTQGIEKLIATILGQNIFASAQVTAMSVNTTAIGVLTAAITANTATQGVHAGIGAASTGVSAAGVGVSAASKGAAAASSAASASTSLISGLLPIIGGAIGGVISGIFSLIGDAKIVTAVHGTTAAVNALGQKWSSTPITANQTPTSGTAQISAPADKSGSGGIGSSVTDWLIKNSGISGTLGLFGIGGKDSKANVVPVRIVGVEKGGGGFGQIISEITGIIGSSGGGKVLSGINNGPWSELSSAIGLNTNATKSNTDSVFSQITKMAGLGGGSGGGILGGLLGLITGFASGGESDKPFIAGEQGPELIDPKGRMTEIIPHGRTMELLKGNASNESTVGSTSRTHTSNDVYHFAIYGMNDPREASRQIADFMKRQTGKYSPANS